MLALVFSAGLITGQRILRDAAAGDTPLVQQGAPIALSSHRPSGGADPQGAAAAATTFSFYDLLGGSGEETTHAPEAQESTAQEALPGEIPPAQALPARYTLQAGAHGALEEARKQMETLRQMGLEPHVVAVETPEGATLYRVRVGKFHNLEEARFFQAELHTKRELETMLAPI